MAFQKRHSGWAEWKKKHPRPDSTRNPFKSEEKRASQRTAQFAKERAMGMWKLDGQKWTRRYGVVSGGKFIPHDPD